MPTILDDAAAINEHRHGATTASTATRRARRILADLDGARRPRRASGRTRWSSAAASAANDVIEPRLKTQWFIRTQPLAEAALEATRSGRTRIVPERFEKTWEHWLTNIRDWNVSRQLWWGHRIPAWYCPDGHVTVVGRSGRARRPATTAAGRPPSSTQDPDIFDTWFSSGLWPFSTLGWPDDTPDLRRFYPTSVMETGYDIIFFWVARMMMLGIDLTGETPFHTVYLSGLIRDPYGQKMSKTKGNVVDPLGVIDETGADALRFALIHGATPGQRPAVRAGEARERPELRQQALERGAVRARRPAGDDRRRTRRAAPPDAGPPRPGRALDPVARGGDGRGGRPGDRRLPVRRGHPRALRRRSGPSSATGASSWRRSGWPTTSLPDAEREATWWTLVEALDTYLRLLHPVMPFVTEAIWGALPHARRRPGPADRRPLAARRTSATPTRRGRGRRVVELVRAIRNARAEAGIEPAPLAAASTSRSPRRGARPSVRGASARRSSGSRGPGRSSVV